jgi:hypothetical protein
VDGGDRDARRSEKRHRGFTRTSPAADLGENRARHDDEVNDTLPLTTTYTSCVVPVAPALTQQLLDACRVDRQYRSAVPSRWTVAVPHRVALVVDHDRSTLHIGRRRWQVELELEAWSGRETQLGIRFLGRARITDRAREGAAAVLQELATEVQLRALLARHPEHVTGEREVLAALP